MDFLLVIKIAIGTRPILGVFLLIAVASTPIKVFHRRLGSRGAGSSGGNSRFQGFLITGNVTAWFRLFRWRLLRLSTISKKKANEQLYSTDRKALSCVTPFMRLVIIIIDKSKRWNTPFSLFLFSSQNERAVFTQV